MCSAPTPPGGPSESEMEGVERQAFWHLPYWVGMPQYTGKLEYPETNRISQLHKVQTFDPRPTGWENFDRPGIGLKVKLRIPNARESKKWFYRISLTFFLREWNAFFILWFTTKTWRERSERLTKGQLVFSVRRKLRRKIQGWGYGELPWSACWAICGTSGNACYC